MDKLWPTLLIVVVVALVFVGMWAGWRRIRRRDAALAIRAALADPGETLLSLPALHVATTHHDEPLDRVVVPGLAFRADATVTVSRGGVTLAAPGEQTVAIEAASILAAGTATWTIDRSVEQDGLALLAWRARRTDGDDQVLDTYLRVAEPERQRELLADIRSLITPGADDVANDTTTGDEA
jgi:hypothetical protein